MWVTAPAIAAVTPNSFAVSNSDTLRGVLTDQGLWVQVDGRWHWVCDEAAGVADGGASGILAVGAERLVVFGSAGVFASGAKGSCQWRAMAGSAGIRPVVSAHATEPGGLVIAFALGGSELRKIAVTDDGGATSTTLDSLALAEHDVLGMVGHGLKLVVAAQHSGSGEIGLWRSDDLGGQWSVREALTGFAAFIPAAVEGDGRVAGIRQGAVGVLTDGTWEVLDTFSSDVHLLSSQAGKALLGSGGDVFHLSLAPAGLTGLPGEGWAAAAFVADGYLLGSSVEGLGDALAFRSDGQGSPEVVAALPEAVSYVPLCESAMASLCRSARTRLDDALGLSAPEEPAGPTPQALSGGCKTAPEPGVLFGLAWLVWLVVWPRGRYAS